MAWLAAPDKTPGNSHPTLNCIEARRLAEDLPNHSWPEHMGEKSWVNPEEFATAWLVALALLAEAKPEGERHLITPTTRGHDKNCVRSCTTS